MANKPFVSIHFDMCGETSHLDSLEYRACYDAACACMCSMRCMQQVNSAHMLTWANSQKQQRAGEAPCGNMAAKKGNNAAGAQL